MHGLPAGTSLGALRRQRGNKPLRIAQNAQVDVFWGAGFVMVATVYVRLGAGPPPRQWLVAGLVTVWGLRVSLHLLWPNCDQPEDPRYQAWRWRWGARYWWISAFQAKRAGYRAYMARTSAFWPRPPQPDGQDHVRCRKAS